MWTRVDISMSSIKRFIPDDLVFFDKMPGDFIYCSDEVWWKENKEVVMRMLDALVKLQFIRGTMKITEMGLYIDYRLPTQK